MREIKFRGKRIDNKEWVYGSYFYDGIRMYIITEIKDTDHALFGYTSNNVQLYVVYPETLGQFTGVYDKNNVPIYENDICKHGYSNGYNDFFYNLQVIYFEKDSCFGLQSLKDIHYSRITKNMVKKMNIEVIGEISENHQLLL